MEIPSYYIGAILMLVHMYFFNTLPYFLYHLFLTIIFVLIDKGWLTEEMLDSRWGTLIQSAFISIILMSLLMKIYQFVY